MRIKVTNVPRSQESGFSDSLAHQGLTEWVPFGTDALGSLREELIGKLTRECHPDGEYFTAVIDWYDSGHHFPFSIDSGDDKWGVDLWEVVE